MSVKNGILFLNLGGPETLKDVRPFLFRLFADPEIIRIPFAPVRLFIAFMISTFRNKKSQDLYASIGGGSPIRRLTDEQASRVEEALKNEAHFARVRTAFTCSAPLVENVVKEMAAAGVNRFLIFPLYPQYSLTTSKGALSRSRRAIRKYCPKAKIFEIISWEDHPLFVKAHSELIRKTMENFSGLNSSDIHLLFSAHSIPEKLVTKLGDPYKKHVEKSTEAIVNDLNWKGPWSLAWQSKLGPVKWLGPATIDVIRDLGLKRTRGVIVDPIAFVTDHIETLEEIDKEMRDAALAGGIEQFQRVPGLNSYPTFIRCLVDLAKKQKPFWLD